MTSQTIEATGGLDSNTVAEVGTPEPDFITGCPCCQTAAYLVDDEAETWCEACGWSSNPPKPFEHSRPASWQEICPE
jgi:hypothetical protein